MSGQPPKVLHINTARTWRGGEQQMVYLMRGMLNRGLPASAVCRRCGAAAERAREIGADVWEVPMRGELDLAAAFTIARLARERGFNILHAHTAHAHSLGTIAKNVFQAGVRLVVHRRIEFYPGRGALGLGWLKYHCGVDAYVTVSESLREIMIDAGIPPDMVFTVRSVTDVERFMGTDANPDLRSELGIPEDALVIGNVGYLVPHKDHENLLEAVAIVRKEGYDPWVVIVGSGPLREDIERRAEELGLNDRLVLTGFRDDVPQLIKMFDLFALSSSEEGICSTLFEVMACETPIVASNPAGVAEAVLDGETGILVPIKDSAALARGILKMLNAPDRAREYADKALERVRKNFTVDRLTEKTLEVYDRVLESGSCRNILPQKQKTRQN